MCVCCIKGVIYMLKGVVMFYIIIITWKVIQMYHTLKLVIELYLVLFVSWTERVLGLITEEEFSTIQFNKNKSHTLITEGKYRWWESGISRNSGFY